MAIRAMTPLATEVDTRAVAAGFTRAWGAPDLDRFMALLHPDVTLLQPVTKPIRGREAARVEFGRLLSWLPDLHGTVDRTAVDGDLALVAWRLTFELGGRPYELRIVDRLVVADGLIFEREAYYDSLALMIELLRRPRAWPGYWRYRGYLPGWVETDLAAGAGPSFAAALGCATRGDGGATRPASPPAPPTGRRARRRVPARPRPRGSAR
jgi:ketosteroid isomerase-like protein